MIKRLLSLFITTLVLVQPQVALAQSQPVGVDFNYEIKPNATDTTVSNKATMQTKTEGTVTSNIKCTEVGSSTKKCGGSGQLAGWPTDGTLTQGPLGIFSHAAIYYNLQTPGMAVDIANPNAPYVYPTFSGIVKTVHQCSNADCFQDYGNYVELSDQSNTFTILYGHLDPIDPNLRKDATVTRTTKLGTMGTTGHSTGIHLHWEFRRIQMAMPNIPKDIYPIDCNSSANCQLKDKAGNILPGEVRYDPNEVGEEPSQPTDSYWFLLNRTQKVEVLYKGTPGDKAHSDEVKTSQVNPGIKAKYPTPLPQKVNGNNKPYWSIRTKSPVPSKKQDELGKYFLTLDDVQFANSNNGPTPYLECGPSGTEQCNWAKSGAFGLHGIGGHNDRLTDAGSQGCVRHSDADIEELYNKLKDVSGEIRYYIED